MRKWTIALIASLILLCMTGLAQATLITIGTAEYNSSTYKLIYDDDDTGYGGGGLVWLDYRAPGATWYNQTGWASGIGASLTVTLDPGYTTNIDWTTGWRLPDTIEGPPISGHEGDPDDDGIYTYTHGYNLANSEMGHLYYTELGNIGLINTDGAVNAYPPYPDYFLQNTGDFDSLVPHPYWSNTEATGFPAYAFNFNNSFGYQHSNYKINLSYGMAVHSGEVSFNEAAPVPEPATMLLLGTGLAGLAAFKKRKEGE